ncbi:MAG TPA: hypothetical protein GX715_13925 [Armatimonadetes bacterium]|jgi:uncharacterized coiled-coil DUF342 family protein|nr:hypothetical protein [Armatimonadota bacterium]
MAIQPYEELIARAQELRERLERMQRWFEENADDADAEGLRWRKERFDAAKREYEELLQVIRAYGKGGAAAARTADRGRKDAIEEAE